MAQEASIVRTVYDYPVAAHLCSDGAVRYTRLVRKAGAEQPRGVCAQCQAAFEYRKPKPSQVRHPDGEGANHF